MLITAAPLCTAFAIASPEALQVAVPSLIGIGTLSTRAPGHTPTIPMPFCGAAATAAVAVPCGLVTGVFPQHADVRVAAELVMGEVGGGIHERDQRALRHHGRRRQVGAGDLRAPVAAAPTADRSASRSWSGASSARRRRAGGPGPWRRPARANAPPRSRRSRRARSAPPRTGGRWPPSACRAPPRRSKCQDPHAPPRPSRRRAAASATRSLPRRERRSAGRGRRERRGSSGRQHVRLPNGAAVDSP